MAKQSSTKKMILFAVLVVVLVTAGIVFDAATHLQTLLVWIRDQGTTGILIFGAIYILATVLFVPGSILTLGAGAIYGVLWGSIYISIASTLGATAAFLAGRYLARDWVAAKIAGNDRFAAIDEAVGREGWKIVGLTRLSPIFPFNLSNYAYGLTKVTLRDYFFASWIGMMPGTVVYVYIGSLVGSLAMLAEEERVRTTGEWVLYGVGFIATVVVTIFVTRLARKALSREIGPTDDAQTGDKPERSPADST
jgi:uncharacterized membrane protein YdjX (TVP38/TMEM64 family)